MQQENRKKIPIDELLSSPAGAMLQKAMDTFRTVQKHLYALTDGGDSPPLKLLEIGSVFQIFLLRALASGKRPSELTKDDWKDIADKVSRFAILNEEMSYSEFVFLSYAAYIDASARFLRRLTGTPEPDAILALPEEIRGNTEKFHEGRITEPDYIDACLWLSLEAMIRLLATLLSSALVPFTGPYLSQLTNAAAQLAFEYGRFVLLSREQAIMDEYLQGQRILDGDLRQKYDAYTAELRESSDRFRDLLDAAFSSELHDSLLRSAELARAAGVRESDLLTTTADIDGFFLA